MGEEKPKIAIQELTEAESKQLDDFARKYTPALTRYFRKRAPQPADVDDLIQEVFSRLARRVEGSSIEQPESYLLRAAGNVWRDYLRKRQTHAEASHDEFRDEQHAREENSPEHVLQGRQAVELVISALNELPQRTCQVFVLCRIEGMGHRAVAKRLGVSVSSIEKHMMKAIAHLAIRLGNRE